ncbi:MAG: hypothetical protein ACRC8A_16330 [Microcoleaceae cyanobacterium]
MKGLSSVNLIMLTFLILGYMLAGGLLTIFEASVWVWLGTLVITLHLTNTGTEAVVLANAWILAVIFIAVVQKIWPPLLFGYLPKINAPLWASLMIFLWFLAIGLVVLSAFVQRRMTLKKLKFSQKTDPLFSIVWMALGVGYFIVKLTLL